MRLFDSGYYDGVLAHILREISRTTGGSKRERLMLLQTEIQHVALEGQQREIDGLRRDIPQQMRG